MLGFGMPGFQEWIVILVIILIFFGAGRLPDVMKQLGKGVREFKDASDGTQRRDDGDGDKGSSAPAQRGAPKQIPAEDELDDEPREGAKSTKTRSGS